MASRYWVGGTGTWDGASTTHWSATSGGANGAAVPTSSDNVFIDSNSGFGAGGTITLATTTAKCANFLANSGHSYTITGGVAFEVYGSLTFEAGITWTQTSTIDLLATTTGKTITMAGVVPDYIGMAGAGGGWTLQDNMATATQVAIGDGTFDANGHNVSSSQINIFPSPGQTPTVLMGEGIWSPSSAWTASDAGGGTATITPETSTIKFTDAAEVYFTGGGKTYYDLWFARGASTDAAYIFDSNTFHVFKDTGTAAHSILFSEGTTQTMPIAGWQVSGTAGNLITINSDGTATHALVATGTGTISADYLNIQHSVATPVNKWYAGTHSVNNQAVATAGSGWVFAERQSGFLTMM